MHVVLLGPRAYQLSSWPRLWEAFVIGCGYVEQEMRDGGEDIELIEVGMKVAYRNDRQGARGWRARYRVLSIVGDCAILRVGRNGTRRTPLALLTACPEPEKFEAKEPHREPFHPVKVLMKDGAWLVPEPERPALAPPPADRAPNPRAEPAYANVIH